ncbi:MAG: RNA polymerase sigma factor [Tannerellaceae bacterium]|jgi:RNA polymerase sigma-70 factor (ECF subfamily)|nr:RNA polymerase sigma factor [Tannerellaceae bacterium]
MEQEQFKQEVLPLRNQLFLYAQRLLDNVEDAEDVVQEVFLKLWYMRSDLIHYNSIPALSMQITKHLCFNRLKVQKRRQEDLETVVLTSGGLNPAAELEQKDSVEKVMLIIDRLPSLQQTILRMKHVDGFEIEEIAGLIGSSVGAVRTNLSRARKKVKDEFFKMQV